MAVWMLEEFPGIERMCMFDFSSVAIEHCGEVKSHRDRMVIWQGDVTSVPVADDFFDFLNCTDVTEHLPEETYRDMIEELHRVLKPGGHMLLMQGKTRLPEHIHIVKEEALVADFETAGFVKVTGLPHRHHLLRKCEAS